MNNLFKLAMFFTSFIPLWATVLFINIQSIIKNEKHLYTEYISIGCILIGTIFSVIVIMSSIKKVHDGGHKRYRIVQVTQEKGITSEFLLAYVLPLFAFDFTKWDSVVQFLIYFLVLTYLCVRNNNVYANLLLEFKKYRFYMCELQWEAEQETEVISGLVISKKNLVPNRGNTIYISPLNKPFYLTKDLEE